MNELLKPYVALVDFLADYLGSNTEVLLHDLTNLEHSIVKIRNGHISGRKEGDPCTDFALRIVQKTPENKQYRTNYKSFHKNGAPMKSGTFFIRNANHEIIGLLCINIESTQYVQMKAFLDSFFGGGPLDTQETPENGNGETLGKSIVETMDAIIAKTVAGFGGQTAVLSPERKEQIIHRLNDEGVFQLKGAVSKAAAALNMSEPSVYRYLNNLKKNIGRYIRRGVPVSVLSGRVVIKDYGFRILHIIHYNIYIPDMTRDSHGSGVFRLAATTEQ